MKMDDLESIIYDLAAEFFEEATVIWAEQVNTKPDLPYVTLKTGNINRNRFPLEIDGNRYYLCNTILEVNLYTKGKAVTVAENVTGNYANTAASDLQDFFNYLESEEIVDRLAAHGLDISLEPPVRDLTNLQNDSKYRYRAMAEAMVSFAQEANGAYGIFGNPEHNSSGGGSEKMVSEPIYPIEKVETKGD